MSKTQCWECGSYPENFFGNVNIKKGRFYCKECNDKRLEEKKKMDNAYDIITKKRMIENAISKIESQGIDVYEYSKAIKVVRSAMFSGHSKFDSSLECMVAIQLIFQGVRVKTQVNIKGYRVDMVLPDLKVVIEVDGYGHTKTKESDAKRDVLLHEILGKNWEVVRIKTNRIERELTELLPWILDQHSKQQELRLKNDGMVPWTYNRNEYAEAIRLGKKLVPLKK